jgi:hypothetical protein
MADGRFGLLHHVLHGCFVELVDVLSLADFSESKDELIAKYKDLILREGFGAGQVPLLTVDTLRTIGIPYFHALEIAKAARVYERSMCWFIRLFSLKTLSRNREISF